MGHGGSSLSQTSRGTTPKHWQRNPSRRKATRPADSSQQVLCPSRQYCIYLHQIHSPRAKTGRRSPALLSPTAPRSASRFRHLSPDRTTHSKRGHPCALRIQRGGQPLLKWCFSQLIPDRFAETIQLALRPIAGLIDKRLELPVGHRVFRNGVFRKIDLSLWLLARKPLIGKLGVKLLDAVVLRCHPTP